MSLTVKQIYDLDHMNEASRRMSGLGTYVNGLDADVTALQGAVARGAHTVTAGEDTANKAVIDTGITIAGMLVQVYRSGILMSSIKASFATTNLTVEDNSSTYVLTAGDVIYWEVWA